MMAATHRPKRLMHAMLSVTLAVLLSHAALAQSPADHNAAQWYQQAINQYMQAMEASSADLELLKEYSGTPDAPLTPQVRAALTRVQPMLDAVRRGTAAEFCDFQLDRSQGVAMLLPHLSALRGLGRLMTADTMVRLHDGDTSGAATAVADLYRMSDHFSDDRTIISSLVGQAVFALADSTAQYGLDRGVFGESESQAMLDGLARLESNDPFEYLEAVAGEQDMMVGWLSDKFTDPDERAKIMGEFGGWGNDEKTMQLMMLDEAGFQAAIDDYDSVMNRVVEIFAMPDQESAKAAMKELEAELGQNLHGPFTQMMLPAFGKIIEQRAKAEKMLADRRAVLQSLISGESKPIDLANAALWYVRAVEMLEQLPPERCAAVRAFAADTSRSISEELSAALQGDPMQQIIDVLREGSQKRRCDFSFTRDSSLVRLVPTYAAGMHDAVRLLHADAVRLLRAGEIETATDTLAICFRIAAHLGQDPVLVSPLIAHAAFNQTLALVQTGLFSDILPAESKPELMDAVDRVSRKDPFGYVGAIVAARVELGKRISGYYTQPIRSEDDQIRQKRIRETVGKLSGDQLLFLTVVMDTLQQNAHENALAAAAEPNLAQQASTHTAPPVDLSRMADVISVPDVDAARAIIPQVAPALTRSDLGFFHDHAVPAVAASVRGETMSDHFRRARSDLRKALSLLRSTPSEAPPAPAAPE